MEPELENLLQQQAEGGQFDSGGRFTLDPRAQEAKIARFGLDSPLKCILRLTQLVVQAQTSRVDLTFAPSTVEIKAHDVLPGALELSSISQASRLTLLSCLQRGFRSVYWTDFERSFTLSSEGLQEGRARRTESSRILLERVPTSRWKRLRGLSSEQRASLESALGACPVPITLNGHRLNKIGPGSTKCALQLFLEGPAPARSWGVWKDRQTKHDCQYTDLGSGFGIEDRLRGEFGTVMETHRRARGTFFSSAELPTGIPDSKGPSVLAHLWLPLEPGAKSVLHFVRDGVVVGSVAWKPGWSASGFVSAHGLDMDLSGLAIVKNKTFKSLTQYLNKEIKKGLLSLKELPLPTSLERSLAHWPR